MPQPKFIQKLQDPNRNVRVRAVVAIAADGGPEAVPLLIRALDDKNARVRAAAVQALHAAGDLRAIEPLCEHLGDRDTEVTHLCRRALLRWETAILPYLNERLFDSRPGVRTAVEGLFLALAPQSIPSLIELLETNDDAAAGIAADLLTKVSRRCPALALRSAIPLLRSRISPGRHGIPDTEAPFREALAAIEDATAEIRNRPIPATPAATVEDRPIPAFPPEPEARELPRPHPARPDDLA